MRTRDELVSDLLREVEMSEARLSALRRAVMRWVMGLEGDTTGFRLASFQTRATNRILTGLVAGRVSASIVCAGTGSGKPLAFYLPALTHIAGTVEHDSAN